MEAMHLLHYSENDIRSYFTKHGTGEEVSIRNRFLLHGTIYKKIKIRVS